VLTDDWDAIVDVGTAVTTGVANPATGLAGDATVAIGEQIGEQVSQYVDDVDVLGDGGILPEPVREASADVVSEYQASEPAFQQQVESLPDIPEFVIEDVPAPDPEPAYVPEPDYEQPEPSFAEDIASDVTPTDPTTTDFSG
jgi:hypothetical protein